MSGRAADILAGILDTVPVSGAAAAVRAGRPAYEAPSALSGARVREALHGLTLRGRSFLAAGATAMLCGIVLGEHDLVRIGVLVALLPLVAALWVARAGNRLGLVRTLGARQVEVGQRAACTSS